MQKKVLEKKIEESEKTRELLRKKRYELDNELKKSGFSFVNECALDAETGDVINFETLNRNHASNVVQQDPTKQKVLDEYNTKCSKIGIERKKLYYEIKELKERASYLEQYKFN